MASESSTPQPYNVPDTPETLARWIWFNYVGIPVTEPYDKEYVRLFDRVMALDRTSFVKGLHEGLRQAKGLPPMSESSTPTDFYCTVCEARGYIGERSEYAQRLASRLREVEQFLKKIALEEITNGK